jgi:hypothetical protein
MDTDNTALKRLDIYRQKRIRRRKCFAAVTLTIILLTGGIIVVDRAVNGLVAGYEGSALLSFECRSSSIEITLMNRTFSINTEYLNRDIERIKHFFTKGD